MFDFFFKYGESIESVVNITQGIVIIMATLFTAWWAYKTFAHKERIAELKRLKEVIRQFHWSIQIFCAQVRDSKTPDQKEIDEKLQLVSIHNELMKLHDLSLYTKLDVRKKVTEIVGGWLTNDRINSLQDRNKKNFSKDERKMFWQTFDQEYKQVMEIIDQEASRWV